MSLVSPVGTGLTQGRVDQGVDYSGSGPVYAVGSGTILSITNSGWPGGTFIALALDNPPDAIHKVVYYAEDISPSVTVGEKVVAGQPLGQATGGSSGIEIGWGSLSALGEPLNQVESGVQEGATAEGQNFLNAISGAATATFTFDPLAPITAPISALGEFSTIASKLSSYQFWLRVGEFALGLGLLVGGLVLFVATSKEGSKAIGMAEDLAPLLAA